MNIFFFDVTQFGFFFNISAINQYLQHYSRELTDGSTHLQEEKPPLTSANTSSMAQHDLERRWQDALNANKFVRELKKKKTGVRKQIIVMNPI